MSPASKHFGVLAAVSLVSCASILGGAVVDAEEPILPGVRHGFRPSAPATGVRLGWLTYGDGSKRRSLAERKQRRAARRQRGKR